MALVVILVSTVNAEVLWMWVEQSVNAEVLWRWVEQRGDGVVGGLPVVKGVLLVESLEVVLLMASVLLLLLLLLLLVAVGTMVVAAEGHSAVLGTDGTLAGMSS